MNEYDFMTDSCCPKEKVNNKTNNNNKERKKEKKKERKKKSTEFPNWFYCHADSCLGDLFSLWL